MRDLELVDRGVVILALGALALSAGCESSPGSRSDVRLDGIPVDGVRVDAPRDGPPAGDGPRADAPRPDHGQAWEHPPPKPDQGSGSCAAKALLTSLGKTHLLAGAAMQDATAKAAPFDLRYQYLAGGIFDGSSPCASCATGCTAGGKSCTNKVGCGWWGCWQYDQVAPGQFIRDFLSKTAADKQIPMITYYEILHASGVAEGKPEVTQAATSAGLMARYLADWRFLLQQIGAQAAILHLEPDFWGYAQQAGADPTKLAAAVASANPTDCAAQPNTIAGLGACMISMVRKYAKNAKVGLHASAWGSNIDVSLNTNPALNLAAEAGKVADFLLACGADADLIVVEASDRDAGYYTSLGQNRWWDATNQKLPTFDQHFAWAKALAEKAGKPLLWWQLPVGNLALPNKTDQWQDNRVDYFFGHTAQIAQAHGIGMAFGAGAAGQTTPETDGGNLIAKVKAYASGGGQAPVCP